MRRTTVRRTALAASALSLALLVTACGSDEPAAKDKAKSEASKGAPAAPAAKALSQAELDKLMLEQADLPNHKITPASKVDLVAAKGTKSDKAECAPLVDAMALRAGGTPAASAGLKIMGIPKDPAKDASPEEKLKAAMDALSGTITGDVVASYEGQEAADVIAAIKKAGTDCAGGLTVTVPGDKVKVTKVEPASYTAGDEAVAYTVSVDLEGKPSTAHLVAVRKGGIVASFFAQSLAGSADQPKAVIDAQVKKLG
ncbi:hypothetical protein ACFQ61_24220 [Streptomyces sp. NPDC056500]|uniref:hypothetical protein n=1 Tax=Streptomyces sp. NPDC056500 TaxID=3345840 RepID=UPI0036B3F639